MDLEKFENNFVTDTHGTLATNDKSYLQLISLEEPSLMEKLPYKRPIRHVNNGLCVIINQMYFGEEVSN